jgi:Gas vesicle protein
MSTPDRYRGALAAQDRGGQSLADILERVLDKGIVIAGDITISLLDIELLTIKLRLLIASVDKAREMGINWWESDPSLSNGGGRRELEERLERLEQSAGVGKRSRGRD